MLSTLGSVGQLHLQQVELLAQAGSQVPLPLVPLLQEQVLPPQELPQEPLVALPMAQSHPELKPEQEQPQELQPQELQQQGLQQQGLPQQVPELLDGPLARHLLPVLEQPQEQLVPVVVPVLLLPVMQP